jgi:hypothetical protein
MPRSISMLMTLLLAGFCAAQEPEPAQVPQEQAGEVAIDQSTPRGALKVLTRAMERGDADMMRQVLHADEPIEQRVADGMIAMAEGIGQLRRAAVERFGEEGARPLTGDPAAVKTAAFERIDAAEEIVENDRAVVRSPEDPRAVILHRIDGRWMVPVEELIRDASEQEVERRLGEMAVQTQVVRQMAVEVQAGQFTDAAAAAQALDARRIEAVFGRRDAETEPQPVTLPEPQREPDPAAHDVPPQQ